MRFVHKELLALSKRAAAWQKGLAMAGANAEQRSYGQLSIGDGALSFAVRGPHGWLAETLAGEGEEEAFEIGADPKSLLDRIAEVYGRPEVELSFVAGERPRFVVEAEGYRKPLLMDPLTGFCPEVLVALPEVDVEAAVARTSLLAGQLKALLKFALHAAPSVEASPQRAVVTLVFEEEEAKGLATDGRLVMCARGTALTEAKERWELHLATPAAERLFGLLSTVPELEEVELAVVPGDPDQMLVVSFEAASAVAVLPLPLAEGLPVEKLLAGALDRVPMATVVVTPRTVHDLQAVGTDRAVIFESTAHGLKVVSRADSDAAGEEKLAAVEVPASECSPARMAVDAVLVSRLVALMNGDTLELQVAKSDRGTGLLVIEQGNEADVSVLAALVGLNIAGGVG